MLSVWPARQIRKPRWTKKSWAWEHSNGKREKEDDLTQLIDTRRNTKASGSCRWRSRRSGKAAAPIRGADNFLPRAWITQRHVRWLYRWNEAVWKVAPASWHKAGSMWIICSPRKTRLLGRITSPATQIRAIMLQGFYTAHMNTRTVTRSLDFCGEKCLHA